MLRVAMTDFGIRVGVVIVHGRQDSGSKTLIGVVAVLEEAIVAFACRGADDFRHEGIAAGQSTTGHALGLGHFQQCQRGAHLRFGIQGTFRIAHRMRQQLSNAVVEQHVIAIVDLAVHDGKATQTLAFRLADLTRLHLPVQAAHVLVHHLHLIDGCLLALFNEHAARLQQQGGTQADNGHHAGQYNQPDSCANS